MNTMKDYLILRAIGSNKEKAKGRIKVNGTTVAEIVERTHASRSKISSTLSKFIKEGYVEYGLSIGKAKTYIITDKGIESLMEVYGIEEDDE